MLLVLIFLFMALKDRKQPSAAAGPEFIGWILILTAVCEATQFRWRFSIAVSSPGLDMINLGLISDEQTGILNGHRPATFCSLLVIAARLKK